MSNIVEVRGVRIGEGMPKICVPVVAENIEEIKKQAHRIMYTPADIVEWRVDHLKNAGDLPSVMVALEKLNEKLEGRPVLFTFRTAAEGGEKEISKEYYKELCSEAISSGMIDMLDIELMIGDELVKELVGLAQKKNIKTVLSNHDFSATPPADEMERRLIKMKELGADIAKIAVMPHNGTDVLSLMTVSEKMKHIDDPIPVITISMAGTGVISRISGEAFGSAVTFASAGKASAPGQVDADELDAMLRIMHRAMDEVHINAHRSPAADANNIILTGFMGAGKTTIARSIAEKTGYAMKEMDEMIEEKMGMTVAEIFEKYGEPYFRDIESELAAEIAAMKNAVVSCGGGTVLRQQNVDALSSSGTIILLRVKPETVFERVSKNAGRRPLLAKYMSRGYISWLMKKRSSAYHNAASYIVDVDGRSTEDIADEIISIASGLSDRKL